ncbi:hypothetical protein D3C72_577930 [compost metagenome]
MSSQSAAITNDFDERKNSAMMMTNPSNGYTLEVGMPGLWCFLFGCFYFMAKGIWTHAVISLFAACCTFGLSWLVYPFFARGIVIDHYRKQGWVVS